MSHDTEEKLICCFKNDKNFVNFDLNSKNSQNFNFDWFLLCKKKLQMSDPSWHWRVMLNLRKTDLCFGKWHEQYGKFSPEHLKVSKLGLWRNPFIQSRKCMILKFTEEICHDNEEWCKIWRGSDLSFQNDVRNLTNFDPKKKNCTLMGSFWTKYIIFELKKYGTEDWCRIWRKTDLCFPKWHEEFGKFSRTEK